MRRLFHRLAAAAALILANLALLVSAANAGDIIVSNAFARASAFSGAKSGVIYFTIMNHGAAADQLVAMETPAAAHAGLHETVQENGVSHMQPVPAIDLSPGASVELAPNGKHVMLTGLKAPLKKGESIKLTLIFQKAGKIDIDVPVGDVAATSADHSGHSDASGD
jgi:periplasmic copper chaperone A